MEIKLNSAGELVKGRWKWNLKFIGENIARRGLNLFMWTLFTLRYKCDVPEAFDLD